MSRILAVITGLAATGAIMGAVLAPLLLLAVGLVLGGTGGRPTTPTQVLSVAGVGAAMGAVLFPATAWWVMRSVPLGRALLGTIVGTLAGGAVGIAVSALNPMTAVGGAIAGYLGAALLLRRSAQRQRRLAEGPAGSRVGPGESDR